MQLSWHVCEEEAVAAPSYVLREEARNENGSLVAMVTVVEAVLHTVGQEGYDSHKCHLPNCENGLDVDSDDIEGYGVN